MVTSYILSYRIMTYKQLFKLEDFLSSAGANPIHIEIEEQSTIEKAFGKSANPLFDDLKVQGLYIVVFPEDDIDFAYLYEGIKNSSKDMQFNCSLFADRNEDGFHRIIVGVDVSK